MGDSVELDFEPRVGFAAVFVFAPTAFFAIDFFATDLLFETDVAAGLVLEEDFAAGFFATGFFADAFFATARFGFATRADFARAAAFDDFFERDFDGVRVGMSPMINRSLR